MENPCSSVSSSSSFLLRFLDILQLAKVFILFIYLFIYFKFAMQWTE